MCKWLIAVAVLASTVAVGQWAGTLDDVRPYPFAIFSTENHDVVRMYKTKYQGCELFITITDSHLQVGAGLSSAGVSMVAGRGCK